MKKNDSNLPKVDKENFIDFLCRATPQEINEMILNRGKPRRPYCPFYVFRNKEATNDTK